MIKQTPILFSEPMVRAILDGRKTQTRRVIKSQPCGRCQYAVIVSPPHASYSFKQEGDLYFCPTVVSPYGPEGSTLWVKETHYRYGVWVANGTTPTGRIAWTFKALTREVLYCDTFTRTLAKGRAQGWHRRPSIFMPTWASRISLEIADIRVQRIQDISPADCHAEGIQPETEDHNGLSILDDMERLWDSINADRGYGWAVNPWVWVVEFKVISTVQDCDK